MVKSMGSQRYSVLHGVFVFVMLHDRSDLELYWDAFPRVYQNYVCIVCITIV